MEISAQMQGVPSEQKPQGSGGAVVAAMEDVEAEVVKVGGRGRGRDANWVVKSVSASGSKEADWR